ncbi:MAG: ferredoxin-NADP reductase [Gammaproteobacteria bacterium]|jgi:ferredoxin-NADP reductase/predicted pyridoxine 5'-phosphate oxidase superfamily flavin-nucleotide-binding protein
MQTTSPFHAGEQAVQSRLGVREEIEPFARQVIRPYLPDQHRQFYEGLPFLVAAARDAQGRPWATLLWGEPGFITSRSSTQLQVQALPVVGDALHGELDNGTDLGLLGIDFGTRRRNRVNGNAHAAADGVRFDVGQSFGNCPQYIHTRDWTLAPPSGAATSVRHKHLTDPMRRWIDTADTFFIATGHRGDGDAAFFGMDASHRGGHQGFIQAPDHSTLVFPDYAGNNHFNTIGNLVEDSRIGLLFIDFTTGDMLQLTGRAEIDWDSPAVSAVVHAQRLITVHIDETVELRNACALRWRPTTEPAPKLQVICKVAESIDVVSLYLAPLAGETLADFSPGQHLPMEVTIDGERVARTYSLSTSPNGDYYRISVKREPHGTVSKFLHDHLDEGEEVSAGAPAGEFVLVPGARPVVLVSAGIGVTPMTSMLAALTHNRDPRRVLFVHGARDIDHHAFAHEVHTLGEQNENATTEVTFSRAQAGDVTSKPVGRTGRVDANRISTLLNGDMDADYYLCGPVSFMAQMHDGLVALGAPSSQIHQERFGPSH